MATPPKRKRLEKKEDVRLPISHNFYCCRCGTAYSRQKGCFPVSHSPMYRGSGHIPICNECIEFLYDQYRSKLSGDREALRRICMKLDLYWNNAIYDMVEKTAGIHSRIRNYIAKTNLNRYIDKTFDDTLLEESIYDSQKRSDTFEFSPEVVDAATKGEGSDIEIDPAILEFWGQGFSADFYTELERRYHDWTNDANVVDPTERSLYKQICILEATINRDSAQGKAIDKNVNALNNLLGSMNLKPTQKKEEIDSATDNTPFGVWVRRWENTKPIPEPDPEFKDVDGIVRYISIWFLGHLSKMLGIKNTYCKLYEDEIASMRIERPEYVDEDDETMFNDIFESPSVRGEES